MISAHPTIAKQSTFYFNTFYCYSYRQQYQYPCYPILDIIILALSMEIRCSLCPTAVLRGYNIVDAVPWTYLICQNCATNGYFKKEAKKVLDLIERVIYQQECNLRLSVEKEYQSYKKKFFINETAVIDTLVNQKTHVFTQKFIKFIDSVKKEEPKFNKEIEPSLERIKDFMEQQTKRSIIAEVKQFNTSIKKEEEIQRINVKKVEDIGNQMKNKIMSITFQSDQEEENPKDGKRIFDQDQINDFIDVFNKKKIAMNKRVNAFSFLFQEGDKILSYEKDLPQKKPSDIVIVEEENQ